MENKIIFSGCSYTAAAYPDFNNYVENLNKEYSTINLARNGNSNDKIIRDIYYNIVENKSRNCLYVCQLTYLHRIGFYHSFLKKWVDYQPSSIKPKPELKNNKIDFLFSEDVVGKSVAGNSKLNYDSGINSNLNDFYKTYLKYIYDDYENFQDLIFKIDLLTSFVEKTKNKILFIYWPEVFDNHFDYLNQRNFFNINGEYSMLKFTLKNEMLGHDSHLSKEGAVKFSNILKESEIFSEYKKTKIL